MEHSLCVYYTASIRGGSSTAIDIKEQINTLKQLGLIVLTDHMAKDADMGKSDSEIFTLDQDLLAKAHVVVAECSNPSLGVGFMLGQAFSRHLPIICLTKEGIKLSAMINGCPQVYTLTYSTMDDFAHAVTQLLIMNHSKIRTIPDYQPLAVYLFGAPGAGKSTVAKALAKQFNLINVSTGQMLRYLTQNPSDPLKREIKDYINKGELVPPHLMQKIVLPRLKKADCQTFGFVLDGYPCTQPEYQYLTENGITPNIVFYFECSDDIAIARQCQRGERSTDTPDKAKLRMTTFSQMPSYDTLRTQWYPTTPIIRINAEEDKDTVCNTISNTIHSLKTQPKNSYMPIEFPLTFRKNSTRFHLHIDGDSHERIRHIYWQVMTKYPQAQGHFKIYPIRRLELGPQVNSSKQTYQNMCNFHTISDHSPVEEAFLTGCMGDDFNADMMRAVLETISEQHELYMTEIEQYLFEKTLEANGDITTQTKYEPKEVDITQLGYTAQLNPVIPKAELHLGFDLPLTTKGDIPIPLETLMMACTNAGFENGGWFIFGHAKAGYRSNQFTNNTNISECEQTLQHQAQQLQNILKHFGYPNTPVSFSYEYVHGIWQF